MKTLLLTGRAMKRAALLLLLFFYGLCTAITGFIVSSVDVELLGKVTGLPVSALEIFQCGSALLDGFLQTNFDS